MTVDGEDTSRVGDLALGKSGAGETEGSIAFVVKTVSGSGEFTKELGLAAEGSVVIASSACFVGARRLGPRARPLVLCSRGSDDEGGVSRLGAVAGPLAPPLFCTGDGPRANIPANAGLKRSASLPEMPGFAMPASGKGLVGCSSFPPRNLLGGELAADLDAATSGDNFRVATSWCPGADSSEIGKRDRPFVGGLEGFCAKIGFGFSLRLFIRAIASGVLGMELFAAVTDSFELSDRFNICRFDNASGVDGVFEGFSAGFLGSDAAFAFISSFFLSRLSFNSSTRSRLAGPPVMARPALPRRMLSFNKSGATNLSVCVLFNFPRAFLNSGSFLESPSLGACLDLRFALKSIFPGVGAAFLGSHELFREGEATGEGDLVLREASELSLVRAKGFATSSGGGDLDATRGGDGTRAASTAFGSNGSALGNLGESCMIELLLLCCLALFNSVIQEGCDGATGWGLGLSSVLVNADSSQVDLVGLHLLEGLAGGDGSAELCASCLSDATDFARL